MTDPVALRYLATMAVECLLAKKPVALSHGPDWTRPTNWPLPIKREAPGADGIVRQNYRAIAILEYVDDTLKS